MAQQTCNHFEPTTNTSSATICKWCGQEMFLHSNKITMAQKTDDYKMKSTQSVTDNHKLTAVDWLIEQLKEVYNKEGKLPLGYTFKLLRQAKQKEKEQIIQSVDFALSRKGISQITAEMVSNLADEETTLGGHYYNYRYGTADHIGDVNKMVSYW